jgi:hypothetical protein
MFLLTRNLATPCLGHKPKARVATCNDNNKWCFLTPPHPSLATPWIPMNVILHFSLCKTLQVKQKITSLSISKNLKVTFKILLNIFHERKMVIHQAKKGKGKKNKMFYV